MQLNAKIAAVVAFALIAACDAPARAPDGRIKAPDEARGDELLQANAALPSDPALERAYTQINVRYFDSRLPPARIRWEDGLGTIGPLIGEGFRLEGLTDGKVILLHPELRDDDRQFRAVLCHEMVHVALRDRPYSHGPEFQSRLRALAERGAVDGIIATDEEKHQLKTSLEARTAALAKESRDLRDAEARIVAEAPALAREVLQDHTWEHNKRVRQHNESVSEFNRLVARYNAMITYPDGLDRERLSRRPAVVEIGR